MITRHPNAYPLARYLTVAVLALIAITIATPAQAASQIITGTTGEGSLYEFAIPENWNGVLAVYAHGMVSPYVPIALPGGGFIPFRNALLDQGIAVAYSSFSENGFAVKDGEQRTHQLLGLFKSQVGNPSYVYIMGHSLGGGITLGLAEKYSSQYDGALPMCGFLGGTRPELEYLVNVRILFDALFYELTPGGALDIPPAVSLNPGPTLAAAQAALIAGLSTGKTQQLFQFADVPGATVAEKLQSVLTALGYDLIFAPDLLARTHGRSPIDNTATDYGAPGPDPIDVIVERIESHPDAVNYVKRYETPTGRLSIPMVSLHTTRDPLVPFFHVAIYQQVLQSEGNSALFRSRTVNRYGHCTFTISEMLQAFGELRAWVEEGVIPAP